jgi:hypothetical protein
LIGQRQTPIHIAELKQHLSKIPELEQFMSIKHSYINIQVAFLKKHGFITSPAHGLYTLTQKGSESILYFWKILRFSGDAPQIDPIVPVQDMKDNTATLSTLSSPSPTIQANGQSKSPIKTQPLTDPADTKPNNENKKRTDPQEQTSSKPAFNSAEFVKDQIKEITTALNEQGIKATRIKIEDGLKQLVTYWTKEKAKGNKEYPVESIKKFIMWIGHDTSLIEESSLGGVDSKLAEVWGEFNQY